MSKKKTKATKKSSEKKSKKASHKKEAIEMESQTQEHVKNIASIPDKPSETPLEAPTKEKKAPSGREKDENGFTMSSKSSLIYSLLSEGKHTREDIIKTLDEKYPSSNNKSALSTFISDLQKPAGTYSTSRGVKVATSEDGILSIEK